MQTEDKSSAQDNIPDYYWADCTNIALSEPYDRYNWEIDRNNLPGYWRTWTYDNKH